MTAGGDPAPAPRLSHSPRTRLVVGFLLLVHWGAVAAFLLPVDPASLEGVPTVVRVPLERVAVPLAYRAWPLARHWLDATSTRQRWQLFAPGPADWSAGVEAVAYSLQGGQPVRWRADTLALPGPAGAPLPHWSDHRPYRIAFNLGYEDWGDFYRPVLARRLCREPLAGGRRPAGIELAARWTPLDPPWADSARAPVRQRLGGWSCWELLGEPRPAALPPRGEDADPGTGGAP